MNRLVVAIDRDTSDECIYWNGKRWDNPGEVTIHACDIAYIAGHEPFTFEHRQVVLKRRWPMWEKNLSHQALKLAGGNP